jgi:hypothetical protein
MNVGSQEREEAWSLAAGLVLTSCANSEALGCGCATAEWFQESAARRGRARMNEKEHAPMKLPVLLWKEGWTFPEPPGYRPHYIEMGDGVVMDDARLPHFLNQLLDEHPEGKRLRKDASKPLPPMGLAVDRGADGFVYVFVDRTGEPVGAFDYRLLMASR